MGLPGTGKSTLAAELFDLLPNAVRFNADQIRALNNDWDFSYEGRMRQAARMRDLADKHGGMAICDFVAPLEEMRTVFDADFTVWMDTIGSSRYEDTNAMFIPPKNYDMRITEMDARKYARIIKKAL